MTERGYSFHVVKLLFTMQGGLRVVEIEGVDINACGGTHTASLAELQVICAASGPDCIGMRAVTPGLPQPCVSTRVFFIGLT